MGKVRRREGGFHQKRKGVFRPPRVQGNGLEEKRVRRRGVRRWPRRGSKTRVGEGASARGEKGCWNAAEIKSVQIVSGRGEKRRRAPGTTVAEKRRVERTERKGGQQSSEKAGLVTRAAGRRETPLFEPSRRRKRKLCLPPKVA